MSLVLCIDSCDRERIAVKLVMQGKIIAVLDQPSRNGHSETILSTIQKLLLRAMKKVGDIDGIAVVEGPGPFTAVRVGVVVANALAWSFGIPVQGMTRSEFERGFIRRRKTKTWKPVMPKYGSEPNITIAKSK